MTEIDVVILNWNGLKFLQKFLPELIRHTPSEKAGIVVADNGSSDGSVEWLEETLAENIRIIKFEKNHGFAEGYNRALDQMKGKYSVLINSDVEVTDGWLDPLIDLIQDEETAVVMPKIKSLNNRDLFEYAGAAGGYIDRWGYPFCRGRIMNYLEKDESQYEDKKEVFWATGACMMIKNDLFRQEGGFDEFFFAHMEEIDLCWRLKLKGYKIFVEPKSVVYHLGGGTLPSGNHRKVFLNARNSLLTMYKNMPPKYLTGILFTRMVLDGFAALVFLFSGKTKSFAAVLKAHIAFYKSRKRYKLYKKQTGIIKHPRSLKGNYRGSIIIDYYLRRIRKFSKLGL